MKNNTSQLKTEGATVEVRADLELKVGSRVRLMRDVERFPHFIARKGATGTIASWDKNGASIKMDDKLDSCEEWDNCIMYDGSNDDEMDQFVNDIQLIGA